MGPLQGISFVSQRLGYIVLYRVKYRVHYSFAVEKKKHASQETWADRALPTAY
jgi:hypothetical protein